MSFKDDFAQCLYPFPPPDQLSNSFLELLPKLRAINQAWGDAGRRADLAMTTLVVTAGIVGIDLEVLAAAGAITVAAYMARCASCAAGVAAAEMWEGIAACDGQQDLYLRNQLILAANDAGIPDPNIG